MLQEFPYQIVTFLGQEPSLNEPVYNGPHGWFAQVALKRRFYLNDIDEPALIALLIDFFTQHPPVDIVTGGLIKPDRMPVQVIEIINQEPLIALHLNLIELLTPLITSRFPERDGKNYYPHITAEYSDVFVIPPEEYTNKHFSPSNVWLLKDDDGDQDSLAYAKIR